jgi:hypothetical protein
MPLLLDLAVQTLADQTGFFRDTNSCTWVHSTAGRGRDCQSIGSDVLANKETSVHRGDLRLACRKNAGGIRTEFSAGTAWQNHGYQHPRDLERRQDHDDYQFRD